MSRIQAFRTFMASMNPIADPRLAIRAGYYVPPPGECTSEMIVRSMELEPTSTHLIVGGIGSGKTSELLMGTKQLRASLSPEGDHVEYVDVSKKHDLAAPRLSGVIVALVGLTIVERVKKAGTPSKELQKAIDEVTKHAQGYERWVPYIDEQEAPDPDDFGEPGHTVRVPGVLVPPNKTSWEINRLVKPLKELRDSYPGEEKHVIFLLDSLDRLQNAARFREAVQDDLKALKAAGIGLVLVGPARFMSGTDRSVTDLFDHVHFRVAADPQTPDGATFLSKVLRARADEAMLPDVCVDELTRASGGTLRDLITLAKRAGEEAYAAGHDRIEPRDAKAAIDAFGRSLAVGLDKEERAVLNTLLAGEGFVIKGERELSLIETRRIILYENNDWRVHPALLPFLQEGAPGDR